MNRRTLTQEQIDWLLSQGISPWAIIRPSPIKTCHGGRAKDGRFDERIEGPNWFIFEEETDLVFWQPRTGEIATDAGRSFALGEELIDNPGTTALHQYLNIYSDPLTLLQNDRRGIVVIDWTNAFDRLREVPRVAVSASLLPTYKKFMRPRRIPTLAVLAEPGCSS